MKTRIRHLWELLKTSFWFVPTVFALGAVMGASALQLVDEYWGRSIVNGVSWLDRMSAEGVRVLLGTVAASSLTLVAISFSATIVSLTLAASQFGPHLLRNFMRSKINQLTLALLLATFVFSLLVLRNVRGGEETFVPHFSTLGAFLLILVSLGFFIVFIHRLSSSLQAEHVIADVRRDLEQLIEETFPQAGRSVSKRSPKPVAPERRPHEVRICACDISAGYLQAIDRDQLLQLATERSGAFELEVQPGDFVLNGQLLCRFAADNGAAVTDLKAREVRGAFLLGDQRTPEQDVMYGVRQLVEIALRALSPGVNDPFTAINCIHSIGAVVALILSRPMPDDCLRDGAGVVRVRLLKHSFDQVIRGSYHMLRDAATNRPEIGMAIVESLSAIYAIAEERDERVSAIRDEAMAVSRGSEGWHLADAESTRLEAMMKVLKSSGHPADGASDN